MPESRLDTLHSALFWLSLPFLLPQGLWVKRTARRLPPAAGPRSGVVGVGEVRHLLLIGDSIIDGVGVQHLCDALPGQIASALADRHQCCVHWQAFGDNGASCADLHGTLSALLSAGPADWVFVSVGVNDVTRLTRRHIWRAQLTALLAALSQHSPNAAILLAGVPPMGRFPALPAPLRQVFGWRAARLDQLGQTVAASVKRVCHLPTPVPDDPSAFASDGYHPNASACQQWAGVIALATQAPQSAAPW